MSQAPTGPRVIEDAPPFREAPGFGGYLELNGRVLPKRAPDPDQERLMTEHVVYEIEQISGLLRTLVKDGPTDRRELSPGTRRYFRGEALVLSYLVHVRVLDDFLYRDEVFESEPFRPRLGSEEAGSYGERGWLRRPDDVLSFDFVEDLERWRSVRPRRNAALAEVRERLNKAVVHLSWGRVDDRAWLPGHQPGTKRQTYEPMPPYDAIRKGLEAFFECVPLRLEPSLITPAREALNGPLTIPE